MKLNFKKQQNKKKTNTAVIKGEKRTSSNNSFKNVLVQTKYINTINTKIDKNMYF